MVYGRILVEKIAKFIVNSHFSIIRLSLMFIVTVPSTI